MLCEESKIVYGGTVVHCIHFVDESGRHKGQHQGYEPRQDGTILHSWERGGSTSRPLDPGVRRANCMSCIDGKHGEGAHAVTTCPSCGNLCDLDGHSRDPEMPTDRCFGCALWSVRVEAYAGRLALDRGKRQVRPHGDALAGHPRLYTWCPGAHGAFGGRQYVVTWDDGQQVGPDDVLWDGGEIPWWLDDQFPPNGTVQPHEKVARPGHTNPFGNPIEYTAHPPVRRP